MLSSMQNERSLALTVCTHEVVKVVLSQQCPFCIEKSSKFDKVFDFKRLFFVYSEFYR